MTERHPDGQVHTEIRGNILLMGIDRAEKYNGFTPRMFEQLTAAYDELHANPDLWCGVVYAEGKHFTAGLDLPKFTAAMQSGDDPFSPGDVDILGLRKKCAKPIVVAVHGICYTIGIELFLAADITVAATDTRFCQLEPKRGIMAFGGATIRMVQRAGWGNAMNLLLRAGEFTAQEAHRVGLVQEIVEPGQQKDRAIAIAEEICANAPLAVQATKASSTTYIEHGEAAAIQEFQAIIQKLSATNDAAEGVASFVERRPPQFKGN
ncbi:MAG: hypothetical protein RLZZ303_2110 [Candidatus Hydrogenedentota bacterium]|jgi:enoyl-CoA hydratase/carnithine racemase